VDYLEQNTTPTVRFTYSINGVATDPSPDTATVTISRADGTVLHTNASTVDGGTGIFSYTLSAGDTSLLDRLRLQWHIGTQTFTTYAEIVGGFYFTVAEALALPELTGKSAIEIAAVRTLAEQAFEDAAGVAFVPRYERVQVTPGSGALIGLPKSPVRAIRDVSEVTSLGASPVTVTLSEVGYTTEGIYRPNGWTVVPHGVTVGYEFGRDCPPERVKRAVLLLAKNWLIDGPIDDRATGIPTDGGIITLSTPGQRGVVFGLPEVEAALEQYSLIPVLREQRPRRAAGAC
jgi:hypothetical protein